MSLSESIYKKKKKNLCENCLAFDYGTCPNLLRILHETGELPSCVYRCDWYNFFDRHHDAMKKAADRQYWRELRTLRRKEKKAV